MHPQIMAISGIAPRIIRLTMQLIILLIPPMRFLIQTIGDIRDMGLIGIYTVARAIIRRPVGFIGIKTIVITTAIITKNMIASVITKTVITKKTITVIAVNIEAIKSPVLMETGITNV